MLTSGMFSSATDEWETPQDLFDKLNAEFHFTTDVCATSENAKCTRYYTREDDGLEQIWGGVCWMNPPYGRQIGKWVRKAWALHRRTEQPSSAYFQPVQMRDGGMITA